MNNEIFGAIATPLSSRVKTSKPDINQKTI